VDRSNERGTGYLRGGRRRVRLRRITGADILPTCAGGRQRHGNSKQGEYCGEGERLVRLLDSSMWLRGGEENAAFFTCFSLFFLSICRGGFWVAVEVWALLEHKDVTLSALLLASRNKDETPDRGSKQPPRILAACRFRHGAALSFQHSAAG
jgi:hypothetical protein